MNNYWFICHTCRRSNQTTRVYKLSATPA